MFATLTVEENLSLSFRRSRGRQGLLAALDEAWNHPHSGSVAATGFSEDHKRYFTVMAYYDRPEEGVEAIDTRVKLRRDRFSEDLTATLSEAP